MSLEERVKDKSLPCNTKLLVHFNWPSRMVTIQMYHVVYH